jgi:hypothetical protein
VCETAEAMLRAGILGRGWLDTRGRLVPAPGTRKHGHAISERVADRRAGAIRFRLAHVVRRFSEREEEVCGSC